MFDTELPAGKRHYLEPLERLRCTEDDGERERITAELARLTFGE